MLTEDEERLVRAHGFRPEALEANRAGVLTPEQTRAVTHKSSLAILFATGLGLLCLLLGILGLVSPHSVAAFGATGVGAVIAFVFGVFLLFLGVRGLRRFPDDLAQGRVTSVEGFINKFRRSGTVAQGTTTYTYHYRIKPLTFTVSRAAYEMLDTRQRYRVFYLPRSKYPVNLEPIGNPLNPTAATAMPGGFVGVSSPASAAPTGTHVLPSAEEVSATLGEAYHPATPSGDKRDDVFGRTASASYQNAAKNRSLTIRVMVDAKDVPFLDMYLRRLTSLGQPVPGLGDVAHYFEGMLIARRGNIHVFMTLADRRRGSPLDPMILDAERRLAEMIFSRVSG